MTEEQQFHQAKWFTSQRFQVVLNFSPDKANDEDLARLIQDASKLLGQPVGHEYAVEVINCIVEVFAMRALDRKWHIENNEKIRPFIESFTK